MFKSKLVSCMLALGLTMAAAPAVLAGPNDTAGNSGVVDKTENPSDAPTTAPGEQSSGAATEESANPGENTVNPEESTTPDEESANPEGEGALTTPGEEQTTTPEESATPEVGQPEPRTTDSSTSLPQTGAPVALLAPVLLVGGAAGYSIYKKSH